ncbi:MAG: hypothetical protein KF775_01420 [Cyclobacteriaceae bacterium]|nr:hypothetical protein [Cyclobacteriaceae bacterium]
MRSGFTIVILLCTGFVAHGQQVTVRAGFVQDSVQLGVPLHYYLVATYPSHYQVVFPDSTFQFTPFEFSSKKYFPTHTTEGISYDSAVYSLVSFEIDPVQTLALPVFQVQKKDSLVLWPASDTVFFSALIGPMPDTLSINQLPLKSNTEYLNVRWIFNYPIVLIGIAVLLIAAVCVWIIFGKRIRNYFKVKQLTKKHLAFLNQFTQSVNQLEKDFSIKVAEQTTLIWKNYMEHLCRIPFTKYTTFELKKSGLPATTVRSLVEIDRMVYGGFAPASLASFQQLKEEAESAYQQALAETTAKLKQEPTAATPTTHLTPTPWSK